LCNSLLFGIITKNLLYTFPIKLPLLLLQIKDSTLLSLHSNLKFPSFNSLHFIKLLIKLIPLCINTFACLKIKQYSTGLFVSYSSEKPNCMKIDCFSCILGRSYDRPSLVIGASFYSWLLYIKLTTPKTIESLFAELYKMSCKYSFPQNIMEKGFSKYA
jgi:hypothetical protein